MKIRSYFGGMVFAALVMNCFVGTGSVLARKHESEKRYKAEVDSGDYEELVRKVLDAKQPSAGKRALVRTGKYLGYTAAAATVLLVYWLVAAKHGVQAGSKFAQGYGKAKNGCDGSGDIAVACNSAVRSDSWLGGGVAAGAITYLALELYFDFLRKKNDPTLENLKKLEEQIKLMDDEEKAEFLEQFKDDFIEMANKVSSEKDGGFVTFCDHANNAAMAVAAAVIIFAGMMGSGVQSIADMVENGLKGDCFRDAIRPAFSGNKAMAKTTLLFIYLIVRGCFAYKNIPEDQRGKRLEVLARIGKLMQEAE
jgi:hypothetical protein